MILENIIKAFECLTAVQLVV